MFLAIDRNQKISGKFGYYNITLYSGNVWKRGKVLKHFKMNEDAIGISFDGGNFVNLNLLEVDEEMLAEGKM